MAAWSTGIVSACGALGQKIESGQGTQRVVAFKERKKSKHSNLAGNRGGLVGGAGRRQRLVQRQKLPELWPDAFRNAAETTTIFRRHYATYVDFLIADCQNGNRHNVDFLIANFQNVYFQIADYQNAYFQITECQNVYFQIAKCQNVYFQIADCQNIDFHIVNLMLASLLTASCRGKVPTAGIR
jgi:uncharacterized protein YjbI with pentapeptide repeats